MVDYKPAKDMTEQEANEYCEAIMQKDPGKVRFVESSLRGGDTYRQIAYCVQNN